MIVHDNNKIPELIKVLEELKSTEIQIGVFGDSGSYDEDDMTVLGVATIHEYGVASVGIPERSFIRATFDENEEEIAKTTESLLADVIDLKLDVKAFYQAVGEYLVGLIVEYLTDLSSPPNAPATIELKGSSNPLIDSGQLSDSITFKLVSA